jgi:hypothetical protein
MSIELYEALKSVGVTDKLAHDAAKSMGNRDDLATKSDIAKLETAIAELKAELAKLIIGTLIAVTAIFSAIVKLT